MAYDFSTLLSRPRCKIATTLAASANSPDTIQSETLRDDTKFETKERKVLTDFIEWFAIMGELPNLNVRRVVDFNMSIIKFLKQVSSILVFGWTMFIFFPKYLHMNDEKIIAVLLFIIILHLRYQETDVKLRKSTNNLKDEPQREP
jgi:hypothetical protein